MSYPLQRCFYRIATSAQILVLHVLDIPNGILLKQNRPKGVMNVVSKRELSARGICQNPLLASSLLKTFAPASCAKTLSTFGSGCVSRRTCVLRGLRSTQMRTVPFCFGTTTNPAHHGIGTFTFEITPRDSILVNSSLIFFRSGRGTLRGVWSAKGCASGRSRISKFPSNVPSRVNRSGNLE